MMMFADAANVIDGALTGAVQGVVVALVLMMGFLTWKRYADKDKDKDKR